MQELEQMEEATFMWIRVTDLNTQFGKAMRTDNQATKAGGTVGQFCRAKAKAQRGL